MIDKTKNESKKNTEAKGEDIIAGRNAVNEACVREEPLTVYMLHVDKKQVP